MEQSGAETTRKRCPVDRFAQEIEEQRLRRAAVLRDPEVQRAAARLRITLDESLGDETPQWIRDLAEQPLPVYGR